MGILGRMNWLKKLVLSNNATLSKEEIAAHCIYDITFYGFSPAEIIENFWKSHGTIQSKMERRESIIQELTVSGSSFKYKDLAYLLQVEYGTRYDYHSITNGQGNRLAYIADSMTKYQQLDLSRYNKCCGLHSCFCSIPVNQQGTGRF